LLLLQKATPQWEKQKIRMTKRVNTSLSTYGDSKPFALARKEKLIAVVGDMPHTSSPPTWRFTSRQPMSSGATCSAGRAKNVASSGNHMHAIELVTKAMSYRKAVQAADYM
jgi:hypothetical protein